MNHLVHHYLTSDSAVMVIQPTKYHPPCTLLHPSLLYSICIWTRRRDIRSNITHLLREFRGWSPVEHPRAIWLYILSPSLWRIIILIIPLLILLAISPYTPYGVYCDIYHLLQGNVKRVKFQYFIVRNDKTYCTALYLQKNVILRLSPPTFLFDLSDRYSNF